ncbi:MAG TPA: histidine phosphatase family protein [Acidobacteriaceae bacterium]|jgi:phosphohistidine phosphatase
MNLFILRHASAGTRRVNPIVDLKRPLDKDGKSHSLHLAYVLNALKISFDAVVSSPLKRSLQTAQFVATETGYESQVLISNALAPTADFAQFQRLLRECEQYENLLVVGHNPNITSFLGQLLAPVTATPDELAATRFRLRKGSLARLTVTRGHATLQWMLDPRIVRALYASSTKSSRRKTSRK